MWAVVNSKFYRSLCSQGTKDYLLARSGLWRSQYQRTRQGPDSKNINNNESWTTKLGADDSDSTWPNL